MTADLSPDEAETLARFEAAADAEESLRESVLWAMVQTDYEVIYRDVWRTGVGEDDVDMYERYADAAIAVMRGDS